MKTNTPLTQRSTLARLMQLMGRKRMLIPLSGILALLAYLSAMLMIVAVWMMIGKLFHYQAPLASVGISALAWWALSFSIAFLLLYFAALMTSHVAAFRVERNLRYSSMERAMQMPLGFYEQVSTGRLKKVIDDNAGLVHTFTAHNLPDLFGTITCIILLLAALPIVDWRMGLVCLIPIVVAFIAMGSMMANKSYKESMEKYMKHLEEMNAEAVEYIHGMPVVKTFQQSVFSFNRFHKSIMNYTEWVTKYSESCRKSMNIYTVATLGFAFLLIPLALVLIYLGEEVNVVLSNMIFYLLITPFFGQSVMKLMYVISSYRLAAQAVDSVEDLFKVATPLPGKGTFAGNDYEIELRDVSFRYADDAPWAIRNLSLKVPEGKRYALVGASGSGKTTITRLVARFWDPTSGEVSIGGNRLAEMDSENVLQHVSFVFQNEQLFKTTIRENITYGKPNASHEEVMEAVRMAQCEEIINKLPDGLDTAIGADGIYLSGGEQQRIALARAFLKDSPILLLDEATAFADPENERAIQEVLKTLMKGRTVLMIAHRLSSVVDVDKIIVMHEGTIAEEGTHQELLAAKGRYAAMWHEYQESIHWTV